MLPVGESALGALGRVSRRKIYPRWIETGDQPDEGPVQFQALRDRIGHFVGRYSLPGKRQRLLGCLKHGGEIGRRPCSVRWCRIRQAFEGCRDRLLEILSRRWEIRRHPCRRPPWMDE